jgi:hypothetical protein
MGYSESMFWESGDYHGHHVRAPIGVSMLIDWLPEQPRMVRVRVRDYTCDCQPTSYELCQAGGVRFIRRISKERGGLLIAESPDAVALAINELWAKLLKGAAR